MGVLEPFFCFVCSDGEDVIRAFHDVFNAGAPRYGGSAACYQANTVDPI